MNNFFLSIWYLYFLIYNLFFVSSLNIHVIRWIHKHAHTNTTASFYFNQIFKLDLTLKKRFNSMLFSKVYKCCWLFFLNFYLFFSQKLHSSEERKETSIYKYFATSVNVCFSPASLFLKLFNSIQNLINKLEVNTVRLQISSFTKHQHDINKEI